MREGTVVLSKCAHSGQTFGITMERKDDGAWHCLWAFKISQESASYEGYGEELVTGRVDVDPEYPGCPYCGNTGWISCGACKKLTCASGAESHFECEWCGNTGEVVQTDTFDLRGGGM